MSIVNDALKKIGNQRNLLNIKSPALEEKKTQEEQGIGEKQGGVETDTVSASKKKISYLAFVAIAGVVLAALFAGRAILRGGKSSANLNIVRNKSVNTSSATPINTVFKPLLGAKRFELTGIMYSEYEPAAIINNRVVKQGDTIEGATVELIEENLVKLFYEGQELILSVQ